MSKKKVELAKKLIRKLEKSVLRKMCNPRTVHQLKALLDIK